MSKLFQRLLASATLALVGLGAGVVRAQTITVIPILPGGSFIGIDAISADGNVVCGDATIAGGAVRAWRWTSATGVANLGTIPGAVAGTDSYGYGMSGDGQVVVGATGAAYDVAQRWTAATGMQTLGSLAAGQPSFAFDASFDGSVIVGDGYGPAGQRAFRWTSAAGMQPLTQILPGTAHSVGLSISSNASTIVGYCYNNAPSLVFPTACKWDAAGAISSLGVLPGSIESVPSDVNADGSVVVGYCASGTGGNNRAFRWTAASGMQDLGFPPGGVDAIAAGLTADGATVVGYSTGGASVRAWVWTAATGCRELAGELQARGINVTGWDFQTIAVSADGSAMAGTGLFNGVTSAWYLRLGASCTAAPSIAAQPISQSVAAGSNVTFSVGATGGLSYQWYKGVSIISGALGASHTIVSTTAADAGVYSCVVTNACGNATSASATLTVTPAVGCGPAITTQPVSVALLLGQVAHFSLVATSSTPLDYQWRLNGTDIRGANDPSYTVEPVTQADLGEYDCAITNSCDTVYSDPATLSLPGSCVAPSASPQVSNQTVCRGGTAMIAVIASGTGPLTYHWRHNSVPLSDGAVLGGVTIAGSTTDTLVLSATAAADAGPYDCLVTGACGTSTSSASMLTVCAADFDCSGDILVQDIFSFLNAWFQGDPRADIDGLNGLEVADIFAFLNTWFSGC